MENMECKIPCQLGKLRHLSLLARSDSIQIVLGAAEMHIQDVNDVGCSGWIHL